MKRIRWMIVLLALLPLGAAVSTGCKSPTSPGCRQGTCCTSRPNEPSVCTPCCVPG